MLFRLGRRLVKVRTSKRDFSLVDFQMTESKEERSPSDDGHGSPRVHRWRSRSRSKSKSPPVRSNFKSPPARLNSKSPPTRSKSKSPPARSKSKSPPARSKSKSPPARSRSRSPSKSRRSRSRSPEASNPGNNLYVTGLSTRVTSADLKKFFGKEGKVTECNLVTDPRSKESRGFAFITMESTHDAERCIKYLNRTVLEGRLITVEKAKRSRGRTPTPGKYQGLREKNGGRERRRSRSHSPHRHYDRDRRERRPARSRSPYRRRADYSESYRRCRD